MEPRNEMIDELIEADDRIRSIRRRACKYIRMHIRYLPDSRVQRKARYGGSLGCIPTRQLASTIKEINLKMENEEL